MIGTAFEIFFGGLKQPDATKKSPFNLFKKNEIEPFLIEGRGILSVFEVACSATLQAYTIVVHLYRLELQCIRLKPWVWAGYFPRWIQHRIGASVFCPRPILFTYESYYSNRMPSAVNVIAEVFQGSSMRGTLTCHDNET